MRSALINNKMFPQSLIVIYTDKQERDFYLESRAIISQDNGYSFGAAMPLEENKIKRLVKHYNQNVSTFKTIVNPTIIPEHLLYGNSTEGETTVVWYRPAQSKAINFSKGLTLKPAVVNIPATLYCIRKGGLYVFALKDNKRPDSKTPLYHAPFFNIYNDGAVCLGSANIGKAGETFIDELERYEIGFYMAEQNGGTTEGRTKTPLVKLWKGLIKSQNPFDVKELVKHPKYKSLGHFLEGKEDE